MGWIGRPTKNSRASYYGVLLGRPTEKTPKMVGRPKSPQEDPGAARNIIAVLGIIEWKNALARAKNLRREWRRNMADELHAELRRLARPYHWHKLYNLFSGWGMMLFRHRGK